MQDAEERARLDALRAEQQALLQRKVWMDNFFVVVFFVIIFLILFSLPFFFFFFILCSFLAVFVLLTFVLARWSLTHVPSLLAV